MTAAAPSTPSLARSASATARAAHPHPLPLASASASASASADRHFDDSPYGKRDCRTANRETSGVQQTSRTDTAGVKASACETPGDRVNQRMPPQLHHLAVSARPEIRRTAVWKAGFPHGES
jgi:hypothetical protein